MDLVTYIRGGLPKPGETVAGEDFAIFHGGKGGNQAAASALVAGANDAGYVSMIGCVGNDTFGVKYCEHLKSIGVNTNNVIKTETSTPTGTASIWVDAETGENSIVVVGGANHCITPETIKNAEISKCISECTCLLMQLEVPTATLLEATKIEPASPSHRKTFLTPAPLTSSGLPSELLQASDVLLPNKGEAKHLYSMLGGDKTEPTPQECAQIILTKGGCGSVIVTLGGDGCVISYVNDTNEIICNHVPAAKVDKVVDTTGAGDAFAGSLAYFYSRLTSTDNTNTTGRINGVALTEAAKRATHVAAYSVARKGAQSSYPSRNDLNMDALFQF